MHQARRDGAARMTFTYDGDEQRPASAYHNNHGISEADSSTQERGYA